VEVGNESRFVACWLHAGGEGVVVPLELGRVESRRIPVSGPDGAKGIS
jgi:hypothetical protein